jgi:hypothetical protein
MCRTIRKIKETALVNEPLMKMEGNEYEVVQSLQCALLSEKYKEIHTRKLIGLQGSESRPLS